MDVIQSTEKNRFSIPTILSDIMADKKFVIFDIETTGLNSNYHKIILIGVVYIDGNEIIIKQFFCNNSSEEKELLESFINTFKHFDFYISFNGGNFDIPFLNKRFLKHNLDYKIDSYLNFDLYKVVRKNKLHLGLNNCKLKTIEKYLGIKRKDTIDGLESIKLYKEFERTGHEDLKRKVLLHNFEDILHLLPTLSILNHIKEDKVFAFFPKEFSYSNKIVIRIVNYKIAKDFLFAAGNYYGDLSQDYVFYNHTYDFSLLKENRQFSIKIPLLSINNKSNTNYTFIDLNELDFLNIRLSKLDNTEKLKYLVKIGNEIKDLNIFNFIREFSLSVLDRIAMDKLKGSS